MTATTVRRIMLGRRLRDLRKSVGLSGRAAAAEVRRTQSTLSGWETGAEEIDINILRSLVTHVYGADAQTLTSMEFLLEEPDSSGQWDADGIQLGPQLAGLFSLETDAELIQMLGIELIPGMLQSENYARYLYELRAIRSPEEIRRFVALRVARKQRIVSGDLATDAMVSEAALIRAAYLGGDQLDTLAAMAAQDNVTLRMIPLRAGVHDVPGHFTIVTLPPHLLPPFLYTETPTGGSLIEDHGLVQEMSRLYKELTELADASGGSPDETIRVIRHLIEKGPRTDGS